MLDKRSKVWIRLINLIELQALRSRYSHGTSQIVQHSLNKRQPRQNKMKRANLLVNQRKRIRAKIMISKIQVTQKIYKVTNLMIIEFDNKNKT